MQSAWSDHKLRVAIRRELPRHLLRPRPWRAVLVVPIAAFIFACTAALLALPLPLWAALPMACALGNAYASLLHFAHEVGHGATVRTRWLQDLILALGLAIFWVQPSFWRVWHNHAHHGHTNEPDRDPDSVGTLAAYRRGQAYKRLLLALSPGQARWLGMFYLFFAFHVHAQVVLWAKSRTHPGFEAVRKRGAGIYSAMLAASWISFAIAAGPRGAILCVVIPSMVANLAVMAYIVTNHMLRPLSAAHDSLTTSMSVTAHPVLDWMHFHFSHHVEHHLFPALASDVYPFVRERLRHHAGNWYLAPAFHRALITVYQTPRLYQDATTLVDPELGIRQSLAEIERDLRDEPPGVGRGTACG